MLKTLTISALALGMLASSALAGVVGPIGGGQVPGSEANMSLIPVSSHYYCTYVRYCVKVKYCYDSYDNKYKCGCYEWGQRCVKHYYKKSYNKSSSSGGSGY